MALTRSLSTLTLLVALVAAFAIVSANASAKVAGHTVYLEESSHGELWTGNCSSAFLATECSEFFPCRIGSEVVVTDATSCTIVWPNTFGIEDPEMQGTFVAVVAGTGVQTIENVIDGLSIANINVTANRVVFTGAAHSPYILDTSKLGVHLVPSELAPPSVSFNNLVLQDTFINIYHDSSAANGLSDDVTIDADALTVRFVVTRYAPLAIVSVLDLAPSTDPAEAHAKVNAFTFSSSSYTATRSKDYPLFYSELPVSSITISNSSISTPKYLATLKDATLTHINILNNATVKLVKAVVLSSGSSTTQFDATNAINLRVSQSSLLGSNRESGFWETLKLQDEACMHLDVENSNLEQMEVNCNDYASASPSVRCKLRIADSTFADANLCVLGPVPADPSYAPMISNSSFLVESSAGTGVMIRNVSVNAVLMQALSFLPVTQHALVFDGTVNFTAASSFYSNALYLFASSQATIASATFVGDVRLETGARLQSVSNQASSISGPLPTWNFVGGVNIQQAFITQDSRPSPVIDFSEASFVLSPISASNAPALNVSQVILSVYNLTDFLSSVHVSWKPSVAAPTQGTAYTLGDFVSTVAPLPDTAITLQNTGGTDYQFIARLMAGSTPSSYRVLYGLGNFALPPVVPPTAPVQAPVAAPVEVVPVNVQPLAQPTAAPAPVVSTPVAPINRCNGTVNAGKSNKFSCVNGIWTFVGNLTVTEDMVIDSVTQTIHVTGNVNFTSDNDMRLVGTMSGLRSDDCIHFGEGRVIFDYAKSWPSKIANWTQTAFIQHENCTRIPYLIAPPVSCVDAPTVITLGAYNSSMVVDFTISYYRCKTMIGVSIGCFVALIVCILFSIWMILYYRRKNKAGYETINGQ